MRRRNPAHTQVPSVDNVPATLELLVDEAGDQAGGQVSRKGEDDEFTFGRVELAAYRDLMQLVCE